MLYESSDTQALACSFASNSCNSDAQGFTIFAYFYEPGLDFFAVGGQRDGEKGEYQLQVSF
jgi:hypothetical protein